MLGYDVDANGKRVEAPAVPSDSQTESLIWLTREELAASAPSIPVSTVGGGRKEKREAVDNALVAMREAVADESAPSAFSSRQWPDESDAARRDYERAWRGVLKEAPGTQEKLQAAFNILAYMWGRLHGLRFLCYQLIQSGRGREMRLPAGYLDALARVAREAERDATDTALAFNFTASLAYERRGRGRKSEFDVSPEEAREAKRAVKEEFARSNMKHSSEDVLAAAMAKLEADGKKTPKRTVFIELLAKK